MTIPIYAFQGDKYHLNILLEQNKTNLLISYYFLKQIRNIVEILEMVKTASNSDSVFMLDSGAFSAWNKGTYIPLFEYIDFIKKYYRYFTHIVCLDVIDNPVYSEVNHLIMLEELKDYPLELIPVFHAGESFKVLDYMIDRGYEYIGISPNNNWREEEKRKWLTNVFSRYDFDTLGIKTHGFGYQSIDGLKLFPLSTADAISWKLAAGYGGIITPDGAILYSDKSIDKFAHIASITGGHSEFVVNLCSELGIEMQALRTNYRTRCVFNVAAIDRLISANKEKVSVMIDLFADEIPFNENRVFEVLESVRGTDYKGYPDLSSQPAGKSTKRKQKQDSMVEELF